MAKEWVNATEGMELLRVKRTQFYWLAKKGFIMRRPVTGPRLFSTKSISEYMALHKRKRKHGSIFKIYD